jgi:uncharacterized membrane protein
MQSVAKHVITGILALVPLAVTAWLAWFVVDILVRLGNPAANWLAESLRPSAPDVAEVVESDWFQFGLALFFAVALLYVIGRLANGVVGRFVLGVVARIVDRVPFAGTIYRATRTLIESLRSDELRAQSVVLIEFPTPEMRAVGIVTRIFPASPEQEELAAVYVPTTPNPTSGFVEIVPTARLIWLDWTKNEAMAFIVSGGAMAPDGLSIRAKSPEAERARP